MLVKYMRLVEKDKFNSALVLDTNLALIQLTKLDKTLVNFRSFLEEGDSTEVLLDISKNALEQCRNLEHVLSLLDNNLNGFYGEKEGEKQVLTEQKTGLEEVMEKLQAISNNKGGIINDNND